MWRSRWRITAILSAGALAGSMGLVAGPASAATGPVSSTPAAGTPQLATTGTTEQSGLKAMELTMPFTSGFHDVTMYGAVALKLNALSRSKVLL